MGHVACVTRHAFRARVARYTPRIIMSGTAVDETKVTLDEATRLMALKQFESTSDMLASALETLCVGG